MQTRRTVVTLLCLSTMAISDGSLVAQSYPTRPIRFIVPFAAGGPSDFVARTLGEALSKRLSQTVVIENRPGADGLIAAQAVLGAPGDGHTLLMGGSSLPPLSLLKNPPPFDVVTDLAPVSRVTRLEWAMYVSPQMPARSIAEFTEF